MEKGDVVSVVATSGEYVGVLETLEPLTLNKPRMVVQAADGGMGFARGVAVTGEENPDSMTFGSYVFIAKSNDKVTDAHATATSSIVKADSKIVT